MVTCIYNVYIRSVCLRVARAHMVLLMFCGEKLASNGDIYNAVNSLYNDCLSAQDVGPHNELLLCQTLLQ